MPDSTGRPHYVHKIVHVSGHYHLGISIDPKFNISSFVRRLRQLKQQKDSCRVENYVLRLFALDQPSFDNEDFQRIVLNEGKPFDSYEDAHHYAHGHAVEHCPNKLLTLGFISPRNWHAHQRAMKKYQELNPVTEALFKRREFSIEEVIKTWGDEGWGFKLSSETLKTEISHLQILRSFPRSWAQHTVDLTPAPSTTNKAINQNKRLVICRLYFPLKVREGDIVKDRLICALCVGSVTNVVVSSLHAKATQLMKTHHVDKTYDFIS